MRDSKQMRDLREYMKKEGLSCVVLHTGDCHGSEYVSEHFEAIKFFSGFSGSNAILIITLEEAWLYTDGRYFIQAENELSGTGVKLMKQGVEGTPDLTALLGDVLGKKDILAVDGTCISVEFGRLLNRVCKKKKAIFKTDLNLSDIWIDRPPLPCKAITIQEDEISGLSVKNKLKAVRKSLKHDGAGAIFTAALDEVMWLFNIRGCDVLYNPVALSYAYVDKKKAILFIQEKALTDKLIRYARDNEFALEKYENVYNFLTEDIPNKTKVQTDTTSLPYLYYSLIKKKNKTIENGSCIKLLKACRNDIEIENCRRYFLYDSAAVVKFLCWLDTEALLGNITEIDAAKMLSSYRKEIPGYLMDSFGTISAYGANAAMAHYEPSSENAAIIDSRGFLLVDSGGQYKGATTDVTRTIVMGELSAEEVHSFTLVACGMLTLMNAVFASGCTGRNLDILARRKMWQEGLDYMHGTGHGVGYCLNVHEGPQAIRYKPTSIIMDGVLKKGMLITDEPGMYVQNKYGIRTENTLLVIEDKKTEYGQFLKFEPLTYVPIDIRGLDVSIMSDEEIGFLNRYHQDVYQKLSGILDEKTDLWLKKMTKPILKAEISV